MTPRFYSQLLLLILLFVLANSAKLNLISQPPDLWDTISVNNEGTQFAVAIDNVVEIRDILTHNLIISLTHHTDKITVIEWSPDDSMLATGSYDESLIIWNSSQGAILQIFDDYSAYIISMLWYPDNDTFIGISGPEENRFKVWNISTGQLVFESILGTINDVLQNPITNTVALTGGDSILILDPDTFAQIKSIQPQRFMLGNYFHLAYHPNGNILAGGLTNGNVDIWNTQASAILYQLSGSENSLDAPLNQIRALRFSPDGQYLSSISGDGIIKVFDWMTGNVVSETRLNTIVTGADFAPDGFTLVYATQGGSTTTINVAPNASPIPNAGTDQTITTLTSTASITLDGSGSSDVDGSIVSYVWTDSTGTQVATDVSPTVDLPIGEHTLTLTVTDDDGATASDDVVITVVEE